MTVTKSYLIKAISPIHIGSGEVYEPIGFAVKEDSNELVIFDPMTFYYSLEEEEREKYIEICRKGTISSILELYKFIRLKKEKFKGRSVKICPGFLEHYKSALDIPTTSESEIRKNLNEFSIGRTFYITNDERSYIPGSSIKGSLRTAYLNIKSREKGTLSYRKKDELLRNLEKDLLDGGSFQTDPFRMFSVSDFHPVGDKAKTKIVYAVNVSKDPSVSDIKSLFQVVEVIEPGSIFLGRISMSTPEKGADIKTPLTRDKVLKSASEFYGKEKTREDGELTRIDIPGISVKNEKNGALLRLGQHSGAESFTIEGYRDIMITKAGGEREFLDHSTTFWLASEHRKDKASKKNLLPFGWALVEELDEETAKAYEREEKDYKEKRDKEQSEMRKREQEIIDKEIRLRKEIEEKERVRLEEEAKRKAEFEAMSPEEKDIATVREPRTNDNSIYEIYEKIDSFSPENKLELAKALKERWKRDDKWEGKMTDKQSVKVQKIKDILGED